MKISQIFWKYFSNTYDIISILSPYEKHLQFLVSLFAPQSGEMYLDAGCGTGNLTVRLYRQDSCIIGLDFSLSMLDKARLKNNKIPFLLSDLNKPLQFKDNIFDGIISNHLLSYLKEPDKTLQEFYRILRPHGKIIISTLRKGFGPTKIFREHIRTKGLRSVIRHFFTFVIFGIFTLIIVQEIRNKKVITFTEGELFDLIKNEGFVNIKIMGSYVNQDVVAIAQKE